MLDTTLASINRPDSGGGYFQQVPVGISKVETYAAAVPGFLLLQGDPVLRQPCFPIGQFRGRDCERDVEFAIAIVRSGDFEGGALLEQEQHLAGSGLHGAAAGSEIADDGKAEDFSVE